VARIARVVVPGVAHHVRHQAEPGRSLFRSEEDRALYRILILESCAKADVALEAMLLLPDAVHLLLVPSTYEGLARAVGDAHRHYAAKTGRRLWGARFQSCPLDGEFAEACARMLKAGAIDAASPQWQAIEASTRTGRPRGSPAFVSRIEYETGRQLAPARRGRKRRW
jgi:putative transposase